MLNVIKNKFKNVLLIFNKEIKNKIFLNTINLNLFNNIKINYNNKIFNLNKLSNIKIINRNIIHIIPYIPNIIKKIEYEIYKFNMYFNIINKKKYLLLIIKSITYDVKKKIIINLKNICNNFFIKLKILREKLIKKYKKTILNKDNLNLIIKNINFYFLKIKKKINKLFIFYKNNI
ncbi:MAG: ribosome recycling factor [Candidatus Shikimatogenerans sp. Tcar]|uniref:Ribosome recycling factor n=1 Tax=Candidatus Shikimatogenerans sp. Tcar TaxID=3158565 RepID=A0AAU7QS81_9FLAO